MSAILVRTTATDRFKKLHADVTWPSFLRLCSVSLGKKYYAAIQGLTFKDDSFIFEQKGEPLCLVECNVSQDSLSNYSFPIEIRYRPDLTIPDVRQLVKDVFGEIRRLAQERGAKHILVRTCQSIDPLGIVASQCIGSRAETRLECRAEIDLNLDELSLYMDLRPSHRQRVQWGKKHLDFSYVNKEHLDRKSFDAYRLFHGEMAGRVTRSIDSWNVMFEFLEQGHGDLVLGFLDGTLVAGSLVLDADNVSYYSSAVFHRAHFDKPLGHSTVLNSIYRAQQRGSQYFDVGELPIASSGYSDKEIGIGHFKHGFSSRCVTSVVWKLHVQNSSADK